MHLRRLAAYHLAVYLNSVAVYCSYWRTNRSPNAIVEAEALSVQYTGVAIVIRGTQILVTCSFPKWLGDSELVRRRAEQAH